MQSTSSKRSWQATLRVYKHCGLLRPPSGPICGRPDYPAIRPEKATVATESSGAALTTSAACLNALIGHGGGYVDQSLRVEAECDALHNRRRFTSRAQHTAVRHRTVSPVHVELGPRGR